MNLKALKILRDQISKKYYKCKDWCYECCTAVPLTMIEIDLMKKELRKQWYSEPPNGKGTWYCEFLTTEWKCSVYNQRPIICRSFSGYKYSMTVKWKTIHTQSCTYWDGKVVVSSKEFIDYGLEVYRSGYVTDNTKNIIDESIPKILS